MATKTDGGLAAEAKKRANNESTKQIDPVGSLCPACNEPYTSAEPDPNQYFRHDGDGDEPANDRAAYEISPAKIVSRSPENAWDAIHVVPELVEVDDGDPQLRVIAYKHDYSTDQYDVWKSALDDLKDERRREEQNRGLGDFASGRRD